jgi:hypothetical protein
VIVPVVLISLIVGLCILRKIYWKGKKSIHFRFISINAREVEIRQLLQLSCRTQLLDSTGNDHEDYAMYEEETHLDIDIRRFTYAEIKIITKDFQSIIGKGGFGTVYHGILENGDEVAVKMLMETSLAESTDFLPEV